MLGGLLRVDFAFLYHRIAVEAQGPYHFTRYTHQPVGATVLRRRLQRAMKWKVLELLYTDWGQMEEQQHLHYVEGKLLPLVKQGEAGRV